MTDGQIGVEGPVDRLEPAVLAVCGRDGTALSANARRWARFIADHPGIELRDICHTAAVRRSHFGVRRALCGSREELLVALDTLGTSEVEWRASAERVVFAIGPPRSGAIRSLRWDRLEDALRRVALVAEAVVGNGESIPLARVAFALAACEAWRDWGVRADAVLGESPELCGAAVASGHMPLDRALRAWGDSHAELAGSLPGNWTLVSRGAQEPAPRPSDGDAATLTLHLEAICSGDPAGALARQIACCFEAGLVLRWRNVLPVGKRVELPTHAFQRQRFPLTARAAAAHDGVTIAPRDEEHDSISVSLEHAVVSEVLGLAPGHLQEHRPLSEYGMDSLSALEIRESLARRGIWLDLALFTTDPSVEDLLDAPKLNPPEDRDANGLLPQCPRDEPFRLTDIQRAYWIGRMGLVALGDVSCHFYTEIEVEKLDTDVLGRALDRLIERHDALRIVIDPDGRQRVLSRVPSYDVEIVDLTREPDIEVAIMRERERVSHEVRPADRWPLFSWRLLDRGGRSGRLQISYDLLIADASSLMILTDELVRLYVEPDALLEPIGVTFGQCVLAQPPPETLDGARDHWRRRLADLPEPPPLPLVGVPEELERQHFERVGAVIGAEVWAGFAAAAKRYGVTPAAAVCGAYALALGRWSACERFTLNVTVYRRPPIHPDVHRVVGDFTSFDLLGVALESNASFAELARYVRSTLWSDMPHMDAAGVHLLRELSERRGEPFFAPVVFTSLLGFEAGVRLLSLDAIGRRVYTSTQTPQVWLDHQALRVPEGVELTWDFVEGLFDPAAVRATFDGYLELLSALADPDLWEQPLDALAKRLEDATERGRVEGKVAVSEPGRAHTRTGTAESGRSHSGVSSPGRAASRATVPGEEEKQAGGRPGRVDEGAMVDLIARIGHLVSEVMPVEELDVDTDLLASGATSIELIQLAATLERAFGVRPRVRELYRVRTVRQLAEYYQGLLMTPAEPARIVVADPGERERIKQASRSTIGESTNAIELEQVASPLELPAMRRRSCRSFEAVPATLEDLAALLAALRADPDGRRRYPSAGASYPVSAFVHVPADGVRNLDAGVYRYDPLLHRLADLRCSPELDRMIHWPSNREIFDQATFGVFLVADLSVIEPLYGELAREFSLVEAGAITQLMMESAANVGLGLCPIGGLDTPPVRSLCGLGEEEVVLLGLLGGRPEVTVSTGSRAPRIAHTGELSKLVPSLDVPRVVRTLARSDCGDALVTGATGFLGAYLVRALLDQGRRVFCLARAANLELARARIRENLARHDLWREEDDSRVVAVIGDLASGEGIERLDALLVEEQTISDMFHAASRVNWICPLETLWETNVLGTKAMVELAARSGVWLHHISSTAVFPFGANKSYGENDRLDHGGSLAGGYPQSKWIAERLVRDARDLGVGVTIHRPGIITGSSVTGSANPNGFFESMIRGCIELGCAPILDMDIDIAPVDYVARALATLARLGVRDTIHLVNPSPIAYGELMEWIREDGYQVREEDFESWRAEILATPDLAHTALGPFADYLLYADAEQLTMPKMLCERAIASLAATDVACPPVDGRLIETYVRHLTDRELLARPAAQ